MKPGALRPARTRSEPQPGGHRSWGSGPGKWILLPGFRPLALRESNALLGMAFQGRRTIALSQPMFWKQANANGYCEHLEQCASTVASTTRYRGKPRCRRGSHA